MGLQVGSRIVLKCILERATESRCFGNPSQGSISSSLALWAMKTYKETLVTYLFGDSKLEEARSSES